MTRLNIIGLSQLTDQHLFSEWREIKMVPKALARSLKARDAKDVLESIPDEFVLGKGHVSFFYNKGRYLNHRYNALTQELASRGVRYSANAKLDPEGTYARLGHHFNLGYAPTEEARRLIHVRIHERIMTKPDWYRFHGQPLSKTFLIASAKRAGVQLVL